MVQIRGKITRKSKFLGQLGIKMKKFEAKVWKKKNSHSPCFHFLLSSPSFRHSLSRASAILATTNHTLDFPTPLGTLLTTPLLRPCEPYSSFSSCPPPQPLHSKFACSDGLLKKIWWARPVLAQQIRLGWVQPI